MVLVRRGARRDLLVMTALVAPPQLDRVERRWSFWLLRCRRGRAADPLRRRLLLPRRRDPPRARRVPGCSRSAGPRQKATRPLHRVLVSVLVDHGPRLLRGARPRRVGRRGAADAGVGRLGPRPLLVRASPGRSRPRRSTSTRALAGLPLPRGPVSRHGARDRGRPGLLWQAVSKTMPVVERRLGEAMARGRCMTRRLDRSDWCPESDA